MPPGQPGWSEGFPEEVFPRDSRSQPGEEEFQEAAKHVQSSWGLARV